MKCQGICGMHNRCVGEVKKVHVEDFYKDWGEFYYCDYAIQFDESNGFTVTVIE